MATIYSRLKYYCYLHKKTELNAEQKCDLGKVVLQRWFNQDKIQVPLNRAMVTEPEGTFTVLSYHRQFKPQIDEIIHTFYQTLPEPVTRKKRARVQVPAYKSNKNLAK